MYAPKLMTWKDTFDRAREAVAYRVDTMADAAMVELRAAVAKAMPLEEKQPSPYDDPRAMLANLYGALGVPSMHLGDLQRGMQRAYQQSPYTTFAGNGGWLTCWPWVTYPARRW